MKKALFYLTLFSGLAIGIASCSDDENGNSLPSNDSELLRTSSAIDYVNEGDFQLGMETANDNASMRTSDLSAAALPSDICAAITIQTAPNNTFPKTFTLDFGNGCTTNGITRKGILVFNLTGPVLANGSQLTVSRTNYFVNDYKVEGDVVFINTTQNAAVPQWTRTIGNGQITTPGGIVYTHFGTRSVKQIEGVLTLPLADNVYEVTSGTHTVTRVGGSSLTGTVVTPLIKAYSCANISEGVLNLQGDYLDGNLDYGNGDCDHTAVYTHSDGTAYSVILL